MVQYSTVQYSTVQYSTVQHSIVQYSTVLYGTVEHLNIPLLIFLNSQSNLDLLSQFSMSLTITGGGGGGSARTIPLLQNCIVF